ncbi:MAG TPA: hypothetical protein VEQ85_02300, partial [Lacipirellulaceae bacterium]|nr:hypothetical protein [Lacipirellulaceae bacterium]
MLRFHETTRRRAPRTAFVLLCAAPTLGVAGWIGHSLRPGRLAHHEAALGAALRADVRLTSWHEPRPGAVRIDELGIAAEQSAPPGLTLRGVQWQGRGPDYGLTALAATLDLNQSAAWIDRGDHWWAATPSRVSLHIEQLTLTGAASETLVLQDVVV